VEQREDKEEVKFDLFQILQDLTDSLTIRRLLLTVLAGCMFTTGTVIYENRDFLFQEIYSRATGTHAVQQPPWIVSDETKSELISVVKNSLNIKFIAVNEVDLQKNTRVPKFWYIQDPAGQGLEAKVQSTLPQPVFDYDAKNTQQMVAVLNNEFNCAKYQDTIYGRLYPELTKAVPTICRIAIPPFYGRFIGILEIGFSSQPSKEELDAARLEVARIAVEIYLRDVLKKS
jgi:hypothetical protein